MDEDKYTYKFKVEGFGALVLIGILLAGFCMSCYTIYNFFN